MRETSYGYQKENVMQARIGLVCSGLAIVWLASALVRVENQRYALIVGMCRDKLALTDLSCLQTLETRTGWWWHLLYALGLL